jgi:hypothetical protein
LLVLVLVLMSSRHVLILLPPGTFTSDVVNCTYMHLHTHLCNTIASCDEAAVIVGWSCAVVIITSTTYIIVHVCACACRLVPGKSHTSFLLEGPMSGGRDDIMDLVLPILASAEPPNDRSHMQNGGVPHAYPKLCPVVLCKLAGHICPF